MTARQAADAYYEKRKKEKAALKAKMMEDPSDHGLSQPTLTTRKAMETMAESNRKEKIKPSEEEDWDKDTVNDMKCQLDLDREEWAKSRALRLLREAKALA